MRSSFLVTLVGAIGGMLTLLGEFCGAFDLPAASVVCLVGLLGLFITILHIMAERRG